MLQQADCYVPRRKHETPRPADRTCLCFTGCLYRRNATAYCHAYANHRSQCAAYCSHPAHYNSCDGKPDRKDSPINCRLGPGTVYELINELDAGENALVVGRSEDFAWWYIRDPGNPDGFCWVSANVTETQGIVEELPIIQPPVTTVTDVNLRVEPNRIVINCNQFPQTVFLEAEITTNGPAFVIWRWEASTGAASNDSTLVFKESGPQIINDYYQFAEPNEYWIRLHILSPNELTEQVNIPVNCTP